MFQRLFTSVSQIHNALMLLQCPFLSSHCSVATDAGLTSIAAGHLLVPVCNRTIIDNNRNSTDNSREIRWKTIIVSALIICVSIPKMLKREPLVVHVWRRTRYMYVLAVSLNYSSVFTKSTRKRTTNIDSGLKISRLWRLLGHGIECKRSESGSQLKLF